MTWERGGGQLRKPDIAGLMAPGMDAAANNRNDPPLGVYNGQASAGFWERELLDARYAGLQFLFYRTRLGRAFRAVSDDAGTAELMGIDNRKLYALALGIAMIFTALAGVLFGIRTIFAPSSGPIRLILAFEAVIIGGLGSMWGTLIGGMVLGIAQAIGASLDPTWQILAGHLAFLGILIVRPSGLFPRTRD